MLDLPNHRHHNLPPAAVSIISPHGANRHVPKNAVDVIGRTIYVTVVLITGAVFWWSYGPLFGQAKHPWWASFIVHRWWKAARLLSGGGTRKRTTRRGTVWPKARGMREACSCTW